MEADQDAWDELQKAQDEMKKLKQRNESLEKDNHDYLHKLEQAGKWGATLLEENKELKAELRNGGGGAGDVRALREEFKETMRQMEEEVQKLEQENQTLRNGGQAAAPAKRPGLQRGMTEAMRQNEDLFARVEELEEENRKLQIELSMQAKSKVNFEGLGESSTQEASGSNEGPRFSVKGAFQAAFGALQRDNLHKRLEEEAERADGLELQVRALKTSQQQAQAEAAQLKMEFENIQKFAQQQRALKYGAQAQLQDTTLKVDNLQADLARMQRRMKEMEDNPNMGHNTKVEILKQGGAALGSLYADLKAGVSDIQWLTTDESDDDDDSDSDDSELADPSMYNRYLKTQSSGATSKDKLEADEKVELPHGDSKEVTDGPAAEVAIADASDAPPKKLDKAEKAAYKKQYGGYKKGGPSAYDSMSKRERKVVKLTINETHKKLLQAFHLIEVLQEHVRKLQEELEYFENVASLAKKINWMMGAGFVLLGTLVVTLFFFYVINKD
mmetsp:Transcript_81999/g.171630  ORF Transcript_81999/g.171630 Transcript_81999/m.171630 type:complete len:501 (-) Transcript_81999:314-1816(-)|eukprot:CAMPEP_0206457112 /NCGR_PEP_ID=MMETSP0324_2-20121206/22769_1 /ASSEMBLY_ACC=CAM_ASM_000836 /TAXON_ID=2866 /ORGANISM="Crypthecodinium cohnii, Strain Seligo" /LENGTH=500 /DNA_ID=CAMNT_0053928175 /DNA_START=87 /DNA_END=1589 /DNA_ORIENTATION=-